METIIMTTTTTFQDGQTKHNEEDEDILMFVEYENRYDFDVDDLTEKHQHHQDHRSRRRRKCDRNDNDSWSSLNTSSDTSENVISKIQRLPPPFSMSNNLLWKSLMIIVTTIMCSYSYSSNSYSMVQAQSTSSSSSSSSSLSSLVHYYYNNNNNQNDNQRSFHHIRWHSNPHHHHHHHQQGRRIFFSPFTFFHHHHHHHRHHNAQQQRIPQIHQYYQVMPMMIQQKQPQQSMSQKTSQTSSTHHLNNLIRKNSLLKHRKHRHTYYSDDMIDSNATSNTATTGRKILSSSFRQSGARSLPLAAPSSSSLSSDDDTPIINSANTKIIYQLNWIKSDQELPLCEKRQVCNKIDTYSTPWIEKQCRCPSSTSKCSSSLSINDEHTVQVEQTKQYKLCETVKALPTCRYFRDIAYTITTQKAIRNDQKEFNSLLNNHNHGVEGVASNEKGVANDNTENGRTNQQQQIGQQSSSMEKFQNENITKQEINCVCPPHSVTYIMKHQVYRTLDGQLGYRYYFVCSPETKLRCRRKEPCRLFTAKKRSKIEAVTTTTLCQCQNGQKCPENHWQTSVMLGTSYPLDNIRTYSGYCYSDSTATTTVDNPDVADSENHQPETMIENR